MNLFTLFFFLLLYSQMYTLESVSFCRLQCFCFSLSLARSLACSLSRYLCHTVWFWFCVFYCFDFSVVVVSVMSKRTFMVLAIQLDSFHHGDIRIYLQYHFLKMHNWWNVYIKFKHKPNGTVQSNKITSNQIKFHYHKKSNQIEIVISWSHKWALSVSVSLSFFCNDSSLRFSPFNLPQQPTTFNSI